MRSRVILACVVVSLACLAITSAGAVNYQYFTLPSLPHYNSSFALDVNKHGEVVGYAQTGSGPRCFYWSKSTGLIDFGSGISTCINNRGEIVGGSGGRAFIWSRSQGMRFLSSQGSVAYAINDLGQIVGMQDNRVVVWDSFGSAPRDMSAYVGTSADWSTRINNSGEFFPGYGKPCVYSPQTGVRNLTGSSLILPMDINDAGYVVGQSGNGVGVWDQTGVQKRYYPVLPYNQNSCGINNYGQVVFRNYLYDVNNSLTRLPTGFSARAISDTEWIVGEDSTMKAAVLVPVPEPASAATLAFGLLGVLGTIKRRR